YSELLSSPCRVIPFRSPARLNRLRRRIGADVHPITRLQPPNWVHRLPSSAWWGETFGTVDIKRTLKTCRLIFGGWWLSKTRCVVTATCLVTCQAMLFVSPI